MEVMKVNAIKKTKSKVVVNNGGNMDLETNGFTSDVSLPKDKANKTLGYGEQITAGQLTEL